MSKTSRDGFSGSADAIESRGLTEPARDARINWQWSRFKELSIDDLYAAVRLREAVFIVEQNCPYPDADGRDPAAWHLLGWLVGPRGRSLVAYARIFEPGV